MFDKDAKIRPEDAETIIGAGVKVEGTLTAFGNVIVKGHVSGSVETKNEFHVEDGVLIEADTTAQDAYIAGEIKGNLKIGGKIELAKSAKINGDITCRVMSIEEGATFNGHCAIGNTASAE